MTEKMGEVDAASMVQNFEGELDEAQLAAILAANGGGGVDEGCAQIVDGDGNLITLTAEQLARAGIDITSIGEADVETLLQLAQNAAAAAASSSAQAADESQVAENENVGQDQTVQYEENKSTKKRPVYDLEDQGANSSTDDEKNQASKRFKLADGRDAEMVGDVTELDEATLASLVQSGSVKFVDEAGNEIPASSVLVGSQAVAAANSGQAEHRKQTKITRTSLTSSPSKATSYAMVGSEVEIRRGNRYLPATIRYVRNGIGYKVQFEDGRFEWVSESDVVLRGTHSALAMSGALDTGVDNDYLDEDELDEEPTPVLSSAAHQSSFRQSSAAQAATPPVLMPQQPVVANKRGSVNGVTPSNSGRRVGFNHSAANSRGAQKHDTPESKRCGEPDFVCPICERKVFNKEPSYIVIRLPACDECAESKILVLDENNK